MPPSASKAAPSPASNKRAPEENVETPKRRNAEIRTPHASEGPSPGTPHAGEGPSPGNPHTSEGPLVTPPVASDWRKQNAETPEPAPRGPGQVRALPRRERAIAQRSERRHAFRARTDRMTPLHGRWPRKMDIPRAKRLNPCRIGSSSQPIRETCEFRG